jgi:malonyl-ACP decarboxylase
MFDELVVSGVGVLSSIAQGKDAFIRALLDGRKVFSVMRRLGRQRDSAYIGAELREIAFPPQLTQQRLRAASLSAQAALVVLQEAWDDARLYECDPFRIGLIVGGSNVQQRELEQIRERYRDCLGFLRPSYALSFMDSDLCGFCTSQFGIRGLAYTLGGASASGQLAIVQAAQAVLAGQVDVCIVIGALMDLSYWECRSLRSLGAMGSDKYALSPEHACRPFDRNHDGFIFGESSAALVIESMKSCGCRSATPYATLRGWGVSIDGNRNPDPSTEGEIRAIGCALGTSGLTAAQIDYVNPHGTGSVVGDETELKALRRHGLTESHLNATKSLIGHGLSAAGAVEVVATLLQMQAGYLHPTCNLDDPIEADFNWIRKESKQHQIRHALTLSMGFGGINTALAWEACN